MAITVRGPSTTASTGGVTAVIPAGTVAGDFLLIAIETWSEAVPVPAGWTELSNSPQIQGNTRLTVFWKVAAASEPNVVFADAGDHMVALTWSFNGVETTGTVGWSDAGVAGPSATINFPDLSSSSINPGDYVMFLCASHADTSSLAINNYTTDNVEVFDTGSYHYSGGNGGGVIWIGGRTLDGGGVDCEATMAGSIYQAKISLSLIAAADPNARVYDNQMVTVAAQHLNDALVYSNQMVVVVIENQGVRRKGFMSFSPG